MDRSESLIDQILSFYPIFDNHFEIIYAGSELVNSITIVESAQCVCKSDNFDEISAHYYRAHDNISDMMFYIHIYEMPHCKSCMDDIDIILLAIYGDKSFKVNTLYAPRFADNVIKYIDETRKNIV